MWTDYVIVAATSATALGVLVAVYQIMVEHEHRRRKVLLDLMQFWVNAISKDSPIGPIVAFVDQLDQASCEKIQRGEQFEVADIHFDVAQEVAEQLGLTLSKEGTSFSVPRVMSQLLNSKLTLGLNALEVVATAWRTGVVDREMLIEEFIVLFKPRGDKKFLFHFREALGLYPSIRLLEQEIEVQSSAKPRRSIAKLFQRR